ncbi:MAG: outer membrane beta-barrel protein [Candidatus Omnitrophota bacterium]
MKAKKMYAKLILFFILAVLFLSVGDSFALRLGNVDVKLRTSASERFDDNITYTKDNKKDDLITTATAGIDVRYEGKTRLLEFTADISRQLFADNSIFDNTSRDMTLNFQNEFSKYSRINIRDSFTHADEPRSFEDALGRTSGRYSYDTNRINAEYSRDITKQFAVLARYLNETNTYSREDLVDSTLQAAGLQAGCIISSDFNVLTSYDYAKRKFDNGAHSTIESFGAGLRKYLTKQLYLDARGGRDFITSYSDTDYKKPSISASLTSDIDSNTTASVSYAKQYRTSSYTEDLFNYWQVSGSLTKRLLERLGFALSGYYGDGKYITSGTEDKLTGSSVGFTYDIGDNMRGNLSYSYSRTDSTVDISEYTKNSVTAGVSIEF